MSFLSRAVTGRPPEERALTKFGSIPPWSEASMGFGPSSSPKSAMKMVAFFSCVRILANSVATLPLKPYRKVGDVRQSVKPSQLMQNPYPGVTWHNWLWMMMYSLAVTGNAFGLITARDGRGSPTAILPVHPDDIRIDPERGSWVEPAYEIGGKPVDTADVFHVKVYPTPGCAVGLSPVEHLASTLDLGFAAESYGIRWFKDSANPSGVLTTEASLDDTAVKQELKRWIQTHGRGRRYPAILGNGLKFQPISISPDESQFLATRIHQRGDVAMMFGIPPHMIGDTEKSTSWGTGIEQQSIGFVVHTLTPWLVCWEQAFDRIMPKGQFTKFNIDALLRGDQKARSEANQIAIQNGWLSINEVRSLYELAPIAEGDVHLQPMNFVPLGYVPPESDNSADPGETQGG